MTKELINKLGYNENLKQVQADNHLTLSVPVISLLGGIGSRTRLAPI